MANYSTVTRITDYGPFIRKIVLDLGFEIGRNDVSPHTFHVHCVRREKDGSIVLCKRWGEAKASPSLGYLPVEKAYPCDASGNRSTRGSHCALEIAELTPAKCKEGDVLSSRYIFNDFRVTQLEELFDAQGESVSILVFDTCTGNTCPDLIGWADGENTMRYGFYSPENPEKKKLPLR